MQRVCVVALIALLLLFPPLHLLRALERQEILRAQGPHTSPASEGGAVHARTVCTRFVVFPSPLSE
jgi:hypothetical protein